MARQSFHGIVVTAGLMAKTVKVRVTVRQMHPKYKKIMNNRKDYLVHDEGELCSMGDIVRIEACRPLSARKHFAIAEILHKKRIMDLLKQEKEKQEAGQ